MSLKDLQDSVAADAALHLPDIHYDASSVEHSMKFEPVPMSTLVGDEEDDVAGLRISTDRQDPNKTQAHPYVFSRWSRSQLLSLFGTKEKWFSFVGLDNQVEELNARLHGLNGYRIRTMKAVDADFPVRFVRGLVSSEYSEIKNTDIMEAVVAKVDPASMVLRQQSGISDRAFYAYILSPTPITIPKTSFFAYPGAVVKNSEVGYTSLWVIPMLMMKRLGSPVVLEGKQVLKRIHRGSADLHSLFDGAFLRCTAAWADMSTKIPVLASLKYADDAEAVDVMQRLLHGAGARVEFVTGAVAAYQNKPRQHTALDIFESIIEACERYTDRDEVYTVGAIAGAVLYRLVF